MGACCCLQPADDEEYLTVQINRKALNWGKRENENLQRYDEGVTVCLNQLIDQRLDVATGLVGPSLAVGQVETLLANQWWDYQVMEQISQLIHPPVAIAPCSSTPLLNNLRLLSDNPYSIINLVMLADASIGGDFILKAPSIRHRDSLRRELLIGLRLNQLRRTCPNFVYTMGGFLHPRPVFRNRLVLRWIGEHEEEPTQYIIYENVKLSETLYAYLVRCSVEQFLSVLLQLVYALEAAYQLCRFTHYDLHGNNVLVRSLPTDGHFLIACRDGYLISEAVAVIIDFDLSYAELSTAHSGKMVLSARKRRHVGIDPEHPYPMHDIYRLLFTCCHQAVKVNRPLFEQIMPIFGFFYLDFQYLKWGFTNKLNMPGNLGIMPAWQKVTHQQFLRYLRNDKQLGPIISKLLVRREDYPNLPITGECR